MSAKPVYTYAATVVEVHDGDTLRADVDLGFNVWLRGQSFRLLGCNARELAESGGKEARDHLRALLPPGTVVTLSSAKADKYGARWDASIRLADGSDLVSTLTAQGWAVPWDGQGAKPSPSWPRQGA